MLHQIKRRRHQSSSIISILDLNQFSPRLWLDAAQYNGADGSTVSSWTDLSPQLKPATTISGFNVPTFSKTGINGLPAMNFGGNHLLKSTASVTAQPFTLFILLSLKTFKNNSYVMEGSYVNEATIQCIYNVPASQSNPKMGTFLGDFSDLYPTTNNLSQGHLIQVSVPFVFTLIGNGGSSSSYINGGDQKSGSAGTQKFSAVTIGGEANGDLDSNYRVNAYIARVALFGSALSTTVRQTIEAAWKKEYKIN